MSELIAIPGYPIDEERELLMLNAIKKFKLLKKPILILAHCPLPISIQNEANYIYYDSNNTLIDFSTTDLNGYYINDTRYKYPTVRFTYSSPYIDLEIANPVSRHNIVCLTNLENALKFAKENGFEWIYFIENDNDISNSDIEKFDQIKKTLISENKSAYFQYYVENEIASEMYIAKVDFMLDNIIFTDNVHSYFNNVNTLGSNPDLESYLYHCFKLKLNDIKFDKLERLGVWGKAHKTQESTQAAVCKYFESSVFNTHNDTLKFESRACSIVKALTTHDHYLILINEQKETKEYSLKIYANDILKYNRQFKLRPFYSYISKCNKTPAKYRYLLENLTNGTVVYDEKISNFSHISSHVTLKQTIPLWDIESSYEPFDIGGTFKYVIEKYKPNSIIEFGVLNGYSSINMALAIKKFGLRSKIKAYDLWEKYPFNKAELEHTIYNIERYGVEKYIDIWQADFYDWIKNPEKADLYHIDISNDGVVIETAINGLKEFIMEGSILIFEGGTVDRDNVEWMIKYNKRPINSIKYKYKILNDNFPGLSMINRESLIDIEGESRV